MIQATGHALARARSFRDAVYIQPVSAGTDEFLAPVALFRWNEIKRSAIGEIRCRLGETEHARRAPLLPMKFSKEAVVFMHPEEPRRES